MSPLAALFDADPEDRHIHADDPDALDVLSRERASDDFGPFDD